MRKTFFLLLSIIICCHSFGQLNIDSLYKTMQHLDPKENIENSGFKQKTFFNESDKSTFQFTLDNKGNVTENLWA